MEFGDVAGNHRTHPPRARRICRILPGLLPQIGLESVLNAEYVDIYWCAEGLEGDPRRAKDGS